MPHPRSRSPKVAIFLALAGAHFFSTFIRASTAALSPALVEEWGLNGQDLGIRWTPPFCYDGTGVARPGTNKLAIKITNLWANRLAGDAQLPPEKRVTRITQKVTLGGPLEAGLLGPVQLRAVGGGHAGSPHGP